MFQGKSTMGVMMISAFLFLLIATPQAVVGAGSDSSGSDDPSTKSAYQKGVNQADQGNYDRALSLFQKALKEEPKNADVLNMLAYSQRKTGKIDQAIENYRKALSIRPRFPEAREYLGEAYLQAALQQLSILKDYYPEGQEQYRELKKAIQDAAEKLGE